MKRRTKSNDEKPSNRLTPENPGDAFHYQPGNSIGYLLRSCYRNFSKILEAKICVQDITMGQWFFLRELWEENGLTQNELSARVGIATPTTAVAIRGMVKDELIEQKADALDRRKKRIFLTRRGKRLKNLLLPCALEVNQQATRDFSKKEIRQLREYINRMKQNLETES